MSGSAEKLLSSGQVVRSRELEHAGLSRTQIARMLERGEIERVARGLYRRAGAPVSEHSDLAIVARKVPGAVICLLSALRFHGLTTQNPFEVWLAIENKSWRPRLDHPPLRFVYLTGRSLDEGVETHDAEGVRLRVFSAARTVADCFKFRNKIGTDVAVEALREFRRHRPKELKDVWRFAEVGRVARVMRPYLESLEWLPGKSR